MSYMDRNVYHDRKCVGRKWLVLGQWRVSIREVMFPLFWNNTKDPGSQHLWVTLSVERKVTLGSIVREGRATWVPNLWPKGCMRPNTKSSIYLKYCEGFYVVMCCNVFSVWPKTSLLLPVWPRDAKRLDTPVQGNPSQSDLRGWHIDGLVTCTR